MERRDEELGWIRQSREGDLAAFEELIRRYQQMIHALTFRMTGSPSDAEDLAQEVFIQAFRKLNSFRGDAQFSTWLYRIGINDLSELEEKPATARPATSRLGATA
jgi:RNA polymerase sigma-70 factor (ECF subfamily)